MSSPAAKNGEISNVHLCLYYASLTFVMVGRLVAFAIMPSVALSIHMAKVADVFLDVKATWFEISYGICRVLGVTGRKSLEVPGYRMSSCSHNSVARGPFFWDEDQ